MTVDQARVRVRWARGTFITDSLPVATAETLRHRLLVGVMEAGDGTGFVHLDATGDRVISVRARDVVAVEVSPEGQDHHAPPAAPERTGGVVMQVHTGAGFSGPPAADGTAFLRQQVRHGVHRAEEQGR